MARTQILTTNIKDGNIQSVDIADGAFGESTFSTVTLYDMKFVRLEYDDIIIPDSYGLVVPNHMKVHGELRILGEVKIC
jgi:hypothetical protein